MVGAGDDHTFDLFLQRRLVDVVSHRHVGVLGPEFRLAVIGPGGRIQILGADESAVDDGIRPLKVFPVTVPVTICEITDVNSGDRSSVGGGGSAVQSHKVVALGQLRPHTLDDIATGTGYYDSLLCHLPLSPVEMEH